MFSERSIVFKDYPKPAMPPISPPCVAHEAGTAPSNESTGGYDKKPFNRIDNIRNNQKPKSKPKSKKDG